ncbi:MAG: F0F1 ATP synthase subunit B [Bacteroidota bacterium]
MELIKPDIGTLVWMLISFSILLYILIKFAWKPILNALKRRERTIASRLQAAQKARDELAKIEFGNEQITNLAKREREEILREAREVRQQIVEDAKQAAKLEGEKIVQAARQSIDYEKRMAIEELRKQMAALSIDIAEKILKEKLADKNEQEELINRLANEIDMN